MKFPRSYVVYDFETTGLETETCEVMEVAAIQVIDGEVTERWSTLIKVKSEPAPGAFAAHGISKAMCDQDGIELKDALAKFLDLVKPNRLEVGWSTPLVGHNILRYDNLILERLLGEHEMLGAGPRPKTWLPIVDCIDTAAIFKAKGMGEDVRWNENLRQHSERILEARVPGLKYNLAVACDAEGVDRSGLVAHRALADVEMCDRLFRKLINA